MIDAEVERSEALTWVAVLMDQAFDKHTEANLLRVQLINTINNPEQAINKVEKLLIVSEPKKTTMYMTLNSQNVIHIVKRILKTLFKKFLSKVGQARHEKFHMIN